MYRLWRVVKRSPHNSLSQMLGLKKSLEWSRVSTGHASSLNCTPVPHSQGDSLSNIFCNRELRLELNVSEKSVWDLTYPALFPSPPEGLKSQGEAMWFFYLAEIALRRLGNRILNYIYRYDSSVDSDSNIEDAILEFESQADGWYVHPAPPFSRRNSH